MRKRKNGPENPIFAHPAKPSVGLVADASCMGDPLSIKRDGYYHGRTEWRVVDLTTGKILRASPIHPRATVNIGEFVAIVDALRHLHAIGDTSTPVYSDSRIALGWVRKKSVATKLPIDRDTEGAMCELMDARDWLRQHTPPNPVGFWWNKVWGENPADFGRK